MPDISGMGSSSGDNLLIEAKRANRAASGSVSHRIATKLRYTARKEILNAPGTLAVAVLGKIPVAGGLVSLAADKAVQWKYDRDRKAKLAKYRDAVNQGGDDLEHLRKLAKWEAKSLKELGEKLEGNLVKLKDAATKVQSSWKAFAGNSANPAAVDAVLDAVCEEERYLLKVGLMADGLVAAGEALRAYLDEAREENLKAQSDLVGTLNNLATAGGSAINTYKPELPPRPGFAPPPKPGPPPIPGVKTPQQLMAQAGGQVANKVNIAKGFAPPLPPRRP